MGSNHRSASAAGFTFAELAFGLMIFVIAGAVLVNHLAINYSSSAGERDRVFAYSKAQAILAEVQNYADRADVDAAADLDSLDDGVTNRPSLTITTDASGVLLPPDHVVSGNLRRDGNWLWSRRVSVQPFQGMNNRNVRYVTVRIYKTVEGTTTQVADLASVINSTGAAFPTSQVFDMYLLAVENIPGWWVYMESIRPFVESSITDLELRNPGLVIRPHWITKASYGRNQAYRPHLNDAVDSNQDIPQVYFYPGRMPAGSSSSFYYVPDGFRGRLSRDGVEINGYHADLNPLPYSLADYWNHAMRYPQERALHDARVARIEAREAAIAAARAAGATPPPELADMSKEPTLRLFLEDLNTNPQRYRNALIINLHGELLPMPALRNFSDAAKEPTAFPEVRVVTHPEELRTRRNPAGVSDAVRLRVYAYTTHAPSYALADRVPIAVDVVGMDLRDPASANPVLHPSVQIQNIRGGVLVNGTRDYFPLAAAKWNSPTQPNPTPPLPGEMSYHCEYVDPGPGQEKFTRIYLANTPVACTYDRDDAGASWRGLNGNERSRLYQMDYVPSCTEAARDFSRNLYTAGDGPKNTARWVITIPGASFTASMFVDNNGNRYTPQDDVLLQVRTRIWTGIDADSAGVMWPPASRNQPDNLSVTWTWWADSANDVPITERSQFNGDPRHNPYKDLLNGDPDFANGYNWFHDALNNGSENSRADYPGIDANRLRNRWMGRMFTDTPRCFELLRKGLVASRCVYTTLTGFSYYYMGIGNDIGYDVANGYSSSIPVNLRPFGAPGIANFVNTITSTRTLVRSSAGGTFWISMPWLGELCPDSAYAAQWLATDAQGNVRGNLNAGTGTGEFYQAPLNTCYNASGRTAFGTALNAPVQRTAEEGSTTFFNIGTSGSTFHHQFAGGNGALTGAGPQITANYHFNMPATAPISRPFSLVSNGAGGVGDEWNYAPYSTERYSASLLRAYYGHPTGSIGSGLVKLVDHTNTNAAYVVVNGIDRSVESGAAFIARFALLSMVHSFFEAGDLANLHRIPQPPRVEITAPTDVTELQDPESITVTWTAAWTRWDGRPYTATTTVVETEGLLEYVIMYSSDGGETWRHVQDGSAATPGVRPASALLRRPDAGTGPEAFQWSTPPNRFPEGGYQILIDCYRSGSQLHFSTHRSKFFIRR